MPARRRAPTAARAPSTARRPQLAALAQAAGSGRRRAHAGGARVAWRTGDGALPPRRRRAGRRADRSSRRSRTATCCCWARRRCRGGGGMTATAVVLELSPRIATPRRIVSVAGAHRGAADRASPRVPARPAGHALHAHPGARRGHAAALDAERAGVRHARRRDVPRGLPERQPGPPRPGRRALRRAAHERGHSHRRAAALGARRGRRRGRSWPTIAWLLARRQRRDHRDRATRRSRPRCSNPPRCR